MLRVSWLMFFSSAFNSDLTCICTYYRCSFPPSLHPIKHSSDVLSIAGNTRQTNVGRHLLADKCWSCVPKCWPTFVSPDIVGRQKLSANKSEKHPTTVGQTQRCDWSRDVYSKQSWSVTGKTTMFIRLYEQNPCLWDTSAVQYRNRLNEPTPMSVVFASVFTARSLADRGIAKASCLFVRL